MKDEKVLTGKADQAKGRIKEAAGRMTGDRELINQGKKQHAKGAIREGAQTVANKVRDVVDDAKR